MPEKNEKILKNMPVFTALRSSKPHHGWPDTREFILERNLSVVRSVRRDLIPRKD